MSGATVHNLAVSKEQRIAVGRWAGFVVVALVVMVAAGMIGHEVARLFGADLAGFDAGYIATVAGIIVGAPIAIVIGLELNRREGAAMARARRDRLQELVRVLSDDLRATRDGLAERQARTLPIAPFLGSGLWDALKAGTSLQLIESSEALQSVSRAYDRIRLTAYLERQAWELAQNPSARFATIPPSPPAWQAALGYVANQDEHTRAAIDAALEQLASSPRGRPNGRNPI